MKKNKRNYSDQEIFATLQAIGLTTWKTKKELLEELSARGFNLHERTWYHFIERHNLAFCAGEETEFIAHSKKYGYILTTEYNFIKASWQDFEKTAKNLLWKANKYKRAYAESRNLTFEDIEKLDL